MWGGHSFSDWMWNVAFDGIGSTVLATLAAVVFVVRQLRHDQELAWETDFTSICRALAERSRQLAEEPLSRGWIRGEDLAAHRLWSNDLLNLAERVATREPCLHAMLHAARDTAAQSVAVMVAPADDDPRDPEYLAAIDRLGGALRTVQQVLTARVNRPNVAKRMTKERCDEIVAWIREGNSVGI